jgi:hypothetical protein
MLAAGLIVALWLYPFFSQEASAQLVTGRLSTSLYSWEKFDTVNTSKSYLRGFQSVQLTAAQGDVSLQTYFTGAISTPDQAALVRLYNLYLRWANIGKMVDLNFGRQAVYAGVGTGTIDGLSAKARFLEDRVTLVGFGGAAPQIGYRGVRKNFADNMSFGGQVVTTLVPGARIGVSYLNRKEERDPYWTTRARDTAYVPVPYYVTFEPEAEQLLGGDAYYTYNSLFSVYGRYDHDLTYKRVSRAQGGFRVNITQQLALTGDYMHRLPRVSFNSIFSAFVQNAVDEVEGGVEYTFTPLLRGFGRVASVKYSDDNSARWTVGVNAGYGVVSYSGSNGYAGELQSVNVQGSYPLCENKVIPSAGVSFASYRLDKDGAKDNAWSILLGGTFRPVAAISVDVQGQWLANKIYSRDLRGFLKFNYWFKERLGLFGREGM